MPAAEVHLTVVGGEATLTLTFDGKQVEREVWTLPGKLSRTEQQQTVRVVFDSTYDFLNYAVNGDE
jgi:hypothetical protein